MGGCGLNSILESDAFIPSSLTCSCSLFTDSVVFSWANTGFNRAEIRKANVGIKRVCNTLYK